MDEQFVGRAAESALLDRHFDRVRVQNGQLVLVVGPSGIGKTSLIRHMLGRWDARIVWVSADPDEETLAGGLVDQFVSRLGGRDLAADSSVVPSSNPLAAGKALLESIASAADPDRPLVIVIDDAQWADDLSLKAFTFAFRRLHSTAVLGVVATRPESVFHLPSGLLAEASNNGARIDLGRFNIDDVEQLATAITGGPLNRRALTRLYAHTDGLPLHVRELLHDLPVEALQSPGVDLPAPRSVEALVLSRLARSSRDTEQLVVAVAVLGERCRLTDAATLAGLIDPLPALEEAEQQGLLVHLDTTEGRFCGFAHSLFRTAVYRDIGAARRAELHRRAVELTSGPVSLEHRVAGCIGDDPGLAADLEAQADADVSRERIAEGARHLLAAVKVDSSPSVRDHRLLRAAGLLIDLGDVARAREYIPQITAMAQSGERNLTLGRLAMLGGDPTEAETLLTRAWEGTRLSTDESKDRAAEAACDLAQLLLGQQRMVDATEWASRAVGMAAGSLQRACAQVMNATCVAMTGDLHGARSSIERHLDAGDLRDPAQLLLRAGLGTVLMWSDDLDGAGTELGIATSPSGSPQFPLSHRLIAQVMGIQVAFRRGRWTDAQREAAEILTVVEDFDQQWLLTRAHAAAVLPFAAMGEWERADAHVEAAAAAEDVGGVGFVDVLNARTFLAFARDDPSAVSEIVAPLDQALPIFENVEPTMLGFWPLYAHALVRLRELDRAEAVLAPFEHLAATRSRSSAMGTAGRIRGCLESAKKDVDAAGAAFEDSLSRLQGLTMPFEEALTCLEYGRFLRRLGQRRSAVRQLSRARQILIDLGASPFVRLTENELGAEPGGESNDAGSPLTARQRMVAEAVIEGKSNREIANELYVSIKTVEFHINQILTRLGVDSRADIKEAIRS